MANANITYMKLSTAVCFWTFTIYHTNTSSSSAMLASSGQLLHYGRLAAHPFTLSPPAESTLRKPIPHLETLSSYSSYHTSSWYSYLVCPHGWVKCCYTNPLALKRPLLQKTLETNIMLLPVANFHETYIERSSIPKQYRRQQK